MGLFSASDDNKNPLSDEQAIARYRYMLKTAPPDDIEKAHAEAFSRLTPDQRRMALEQLAAVVPRQEAVTASEDPRSLARLATRTEIRQPGVLERIFGSVQPGYGGGMGFGGGGIGLGGVMAGSLFASLAGSFMGTAIASNFMGDHPEAASLGGGLDDSNWDGANSSLDHLGPDGTAEYADSSFDDSALDGGGFGDGFE